MSAQRGLTTTHALLADWCKAERPVIPKGSEIINQHCEIRHLEADVEVTGVCIKFR